MGAFIFRITQKCNLMAVGFGEFPSKSQNLNTHNVGRCGSVSFNVHLHSPLRTHP